MTKLVKCIPVEVKVLLEDTGSAYPPANCDSFPRRTTSENLTKENVIPPTFELKDRDEPLSALRKVMEQKAHALVLSRNLRLEASTLKCQEVESATV